MKAKGNGQAWFYHAPNKKKVVEQLAAPPASQIPGLSAVLDDVHEPELGTRNWIRETDSKYVQLAKKGGRKHLFSFPDRKRKVEEADGPKPYPRVEWFDHGPSEEDAAATGNQWEPPEYMVHLPLHEVQEKPTEIETYELGQARINGIEIQQKYEGRGVPYYTDDTAAFDQELPKLVKFDENKNNNNNQFSKLIGGGFGTDWLVNMGDVRKKQLKKHKQPHASGHLTEYQQSIARQELPKRKLKPILVNPGSKRAPLAQTKPFKLSKFEKVGPKISTRS